MCPTNFKNGISSPPGKPPKRLWVSTLKLLVIIALWGGEVCNLHLHFSLFPPPLLHSGQRISPLNQQMCCDLHRSIHLWRPNISLPLLPCSLPTIGCFLFLVAQGEPHVENALRNSINSWFNWIVTGSVGEHAMEWGPFLALPHLSCLWIQAEARIYGEASTGTCSGGEEVTMPKKQNLLRCHHPFPYPPAFSRFGYLLLQNMESRTNPKVYWRRTVYLILCLDYLLLPLELDRNLGLAVHYTPYFFVFTLDALLAAAQLPNFDIIPPFVYAQNFLLESS